LQKEANTGRQNFYTFEKHTIILTPLLFTVYILLFTWLITRLPFFRKSGLGGKWLIGLFLLKIAAGCFYGYVHTLSQYYPDKIDTWRFFFQSLPETELLKKDPAAFWKSLFGNGYEHTGGFLSNANSYWNDLKHNIMLLLMSLFNLFSRGNYYINVVFYNFIAFSGLVALYRVFTASFPHKRTVVFISIFLIPSVVFWGSGFHKEGLLLSALGFILYHLIGHQSPVTSHQSPVTSHKSQVTGHLKKYPVYKLPLTIFLLALLLLLRPYILFALIPALFGWFVCTYKKWKPTRVFAMIYLVMLVLFFGASVLSRKTNLPAAISNVQHDFLQLGGNTIAVTDSLQPSTIGFLQYAPHAMDMAFLRPRPGEGGITYLPSMFENIGLLILFLLFLFYRQREENQRPLLYFMAGYALTLLLLIGFSVPVTGAVIRYKVLAIPFLVLFFALQIEWKKVLKVKIHNK
jgi:hypothetical protein